MIPYKRAVEMLDEKGKIINKGTAIALVSTIGPDGPLSSVLIELIDDNNYTIVVPAPLGFCRFPPLEVNL